VHLVGLGLKPFEKPPHAIKSIASIDNGFLLGSFQALKGDMSGNLFTPAKGHHILKFQALLFSASPGFNGTLPKGESGVGDNKIQVNIDRAAKSTAGFTGPYGAVKREKVGEGRPVGETTFSAFQPGAEGKVMSRLYP
jgi:hypothetical protein